MCKRVIPLSFFWRDDNASSLLPESRRSDRNGMLGPLSVIKRTMSRDIMRRSPINFLVAGEIPFSPGDYALFFRACMG